MRFAMLLVLGFVLSCLQLRGIYAEEKPDPRAAVETALEHYITVLEKRDFTKLFQECFLPSEMKVILQGTTVEELVKKIGTIPETDANFTDTIARLKGLQSKTPVYNDEKTEAKYPEIKKGAVAERLTFVKEGNLWYISLLRKETTHRKPQEAAEPKQ